MPTLTVVPVRAGTCDWHAPLVVMPCVVIQRQGNAMGSLFAVGRDGVRRAGLVVDPSAADGKERNGLSLALFCLLRPDVMVMHRLMLK